jgi:hypothetical protein
MDPDGLVCFPAGSIGDVTPVTLAFRELLPYGFDLQLK